MRDLYYEGFSSLFPDKKTAYKLSHAADLQLSLHDVDDKAQDDYNGHEALKPGTFIKTPQ